MPSTKQRRRAKRHAEQLVEEAIEAAASDELVLAEKLIQRALSAGPANARFWLEAARIAAQRGQSRRAHRAVRRALELSPGYAEARELLGELSPPAPSDVRVVEPDIADDEPPSFTARTARFDWDELASELTTRGVVRLQALLSPAECVAVRSLFATAAAFEHDVHLDDDRGRVVYRFFTRPLPELVSALRHEVYARLAPIANRWNELVGDRARWPASHSQFERAYRAGGHGRTSPILLRYEPGGFNALAISLGPATIRDGGELALIDERPGKRKRVRVVATEAGDAVIFCTRDRLCPIAGLYGRQAVMHGVQEVRAERYAIGIPFHDYLG